MQYPRFPTFPNKAAAAAAKAVQLAQCKKHALFLHAMNPVLIFLAPVFFASVATVLTFWIQNWVPGVINKNKKPAESTPGIASSTTAEDTTAIPGPTSRDAEQGVPGDEPPPYQPPSETALAVVPPKNLPWEEHSSAMRFVVGSGYLALITTFLLLCALSIEASIYCLEVGNSTVGQVIWWLLFSIPCVWASTALSCWAMLLRDLWGPRMKKRFPFKETAIIYALICVITAPFAMVFYIVGGGAVKAVEACQHWFCGDALLEDGDEDAGAGMELEEGRQAGSRRAPDVVGSGSGNTVDEESEALMGRDEK